MKLTVQRKPADQVEAEALIVPVFQGRRDARFGAGDLFDSGEIAGKPLDHPRWVKITTHFFENFAYLLQQMDAINEGDRSLLGNSIVYINSEFGDGDAHNQQDLPTIVAGKAGGKFKTGQLISLARQTPVSNVVLTIMQTMGLNQSSFGDSTGTVSSLLV